MSLVIRRTIGLMAAMAALVIAATVMFGSGATVGANTTSINTFDRAAVQASWQSQVAGQLTVNHGWTGDEDRCIAGDASAAYDAATLQTINWFRAMTGLAPVSEDPAMSREAQAAALMMHAGWSLSHYPAQSWPCWSQAGADAAGSSNLTLGVAGARGVMGQIEDPGASNVALGHRRWLLYPALERVGIGNTSSASAIALFDGIGARPATNQWVSWPPPGYVPADAVFPRWSLSHAGADFSNASVSMTENGQAVDVRLLPVSNGFGDNTLGWEPVGITPDRGSDVRYVVTVRNIRVDGQAVDRRWEFVAFSADAARPTSPTAVTHQCMGRTATIVGTEGRDRIQGTNGDDVIVSLGGDDLINALGGNDVICAGGGDDIVNGGRGDDAIAGGANRDRLRGGPGDDTIMGETGRDAVVGNAGRDTLIGGDRLDTLLGGGGRDVCFGEAVTASSAYDDTYESCEGIRR